MGKRTVLFAPQLISEIARICRKLGAETLTLELGDTGDIRVTITGDRVKDYDGLSTIQVKQDVAYDEGELISFSETYTWRNL